ncbi:MAG TPA: cache domain-containing protein [Anaerolineae bacterium]|nr:cache domain-containing protein [Anaerolineae bacterium]
MQNDIGKKELIVVGVIISLYVVGAVFVTQFEQAGMVLSMMLLAISLALTVWFVPPTQFLPYFLLVVVLSMGVMVEDFYWLGERDILNDAIVDGIWVGIGGLLLFVIYVVGRTFIRYPFQTQLLLLLLLVAVVPMGLLSEWQNRFARERLLAAHNEALNAASVQMALSIDEFLRSQTLDIRAETGLLGLADYFLLPVGERVGSVQEAYVANLLKVFRDKDPLHIRSYAVLDLNGQVILAYPETAVPERNLVGTDYFLEALTSSQPYISSVQFPSQAPVGFFYVSQVIKNGRGEVVGVLRSEYNASVFQEIISQGTGLVGAGSFGALYDDNYLHLAHGEDRGVIYRFVEPIGAERMSSLQATKRWPSLPEATVSVDLVDLATKLDIAYQEPYFVTQAVPDDDLLMQAAVSFVAEKPWSVVFYQSQARFLAPIEAQSQSVVLIILATAVVVLLLAGGAPKLMPLSWQEKGGP